VLYTDVSKIEIGGTYRVIVGIESKDRFLSEEKLTELCREALRKKDFHSKNVFGFYGGEVLYRPSSGKVPEIDEL